MRQMAGEATGAAVRGIVLEIKAVIDNPIAVVVEPVARLGCGRDVAMACAPVAVGLTLPRAGAADADVLRPGRTGVTGFIRPRTA